ncbi:MAG TPA: hypothetical protein VLB04_04945 [Methanotrichaceae archaeon]|nr:hypothetical protein [Methanotrichaceae archaeon]
MPNDNSPKDRMMSPVAVVVAFANFDDAYGRGDFLQEGRASAGSDAVVAHFEYVAVEVGG